MPRPCRNDRRTLRVDGLRRRRPLVGTQRGPQGYAPKGPSPRRKKQSCSSPSSDQRYKASTRFATFLCEISASFLSKRGNSLAWVASCCECPTMTHRTSRNLRLGDRIGRKRRKEFEIVTTIVGLVCATQLFCISNPNTAHTKNFIASGTKPTQSHFPGAAKTPCAIRPSIPPSISCKPSATWLTPRITPRSSSSGLNQRTTKCATSIASQSRNRMK